MKTYIFLLLNLISWSQSFAQQGPVIECFNCDGLTEKPYPTNGSWYNPQQSGSGYILEVQNGLLSGFYFGYNTEGVPTWTNFVGFLEEGEGEVLWALDANMLKFENGNAFNQPFQPPTSENSGDSIHIDFIFKNYAKVSVNGGEAQNMVPLTFGVPLSNDFSDIDFLFPELEGIWTFVYNSNDPAYLEEYNYGSQAYFITQKGAINNPDGSSTLMYIIYRYSPPVEVNGVGFIRCENQLDVNVGSSEIVCRLDGFPVSGQSMVIPIGDLGAFAFSAEDSGGGVLNAYRVNHLNLSNN